MQTLRSGDTFTIEAKVLHVVELGGDSNFCLEMPSGRTVWVLGSQLGAQTEAPDTKVVPGPPATKTTRKPRRATE